jgi:hypothetical protein
MRVGRSFDHLVAHEVVKRVAIKHRAVGLRERVDYFKRLAFYTITEEEAAQYSEWVHLTGSKPEDIEVVTSLDEVDLEAMHRALDCYVTYAATIEESGIKRDIPREAVFEIYQEAHDPPLNSLFERVTEIGEIVS